MLTHRRMRKAARLMQQVGELRPGFIKEDEASLEGPVAHGGAFAVSDSSSAVDSPVSGTGRTVRVKLVFQQDQNTGEVQIVRRG